MRARRLIGHKANLKWPQGPGLIDFGRAGRVMTSVQTADWPGAGRARCRRGQAQKGPMISARGRRWWVMVWLKAGMYFPFIYKLYAVFFSSAPACIVAATAA